MQAPIPLVGRSFLYEPWFWFALLCGPLTWLVLWGIGLPVTGVVHLSVGVLLLSVLVYPVLEEIVFRGFLQEWLLIRPAFQPSRYGITLANVATSCVFALLHLMSQPPLWALSIVFPSLVFGWLRDRYSNLLPGILVHMFYNAGLLLIFG